MAFLKGYGALPAAALMTACHSFSQYISPQVEGRVVDAQTHEPLADTRVEKLSFKRNLNPTEPPKGGQLLIQHNAIFTGADGTFVLDSQKAVGLFRSVFWYSVKLSFQHAGYELFTTNYTPANATNTVSGTPLIEAGDILLVPLSGKTPAMNSPATTTTNSEVNPIKKRMKPLHSRKTKNRIVATPALLLSLALFLSACSSAPPPSGPITSGAAYETQPGFGGQTIVNTLTQIDTVVAIDEAHRTLELKHPDGRITVYHCGPEIANFSQIKVGDRVKATVVEEMAVFLKPATAAESLSQSAVVIRATNGSLPGFKNVDTLNFTAKIMAIDVMGGTVTLQLATGQNRTIHCSDAINLADFTVGDDVSVKTIDSTSIAVEKP